MKKTSVYKKLIIAFISVALLSAIGLTLFFISQGGQQQSITSATMAQSSQVERGDINNAIEGTGRLAVADSSVVQIPKGLVIEKIKVQNGQAIRTGDVIATVTKASVASELLTVREQIETVEENIENLDEDEVADTDSVEYLEKLVLEAELAELQSNENLLNKIMKKGEIVAPTSGTIDDLNIVEGSSVETAVNNSNNSSSNNSSVGNSNATNFMSTSSTNATTLLPSSETSAKVQVTALSSSTPAVKKQTMSLSSSDDPSKRQTMSLSSSEVSTNMGVDVPAETTFAVTPTATPPSSTPTSITAIGINELNIAVPTTGAIPQNVIESIAGVNYTGTITWDNANKTFNAGVSYTATIVLTANENYTFASDILVEMANTQLISWTVYNSGNEKNSLRIVAKYEATSTFAGGGGTSGDPSGAGNTGGVGNIGGTGNTGGMTMGGTTSGGSQSIPSGSTSGSTETSGTGSNRTTTSANSLLTTIATIGNNEVVEVNISVDELDILTVEEGQEATITLEAVGSESFEGVVTAISSEASQGDSSVKYTVGIEMAKAANMLIGMSAAATINVETVKDVLTIPVNALQESGDRVFVYTSADENGNLIGEVDVTTGLSDGNQVEVLEGLNEGDTVYYMRVTSENSSSPFGGGGVYTFGGGGAMPSMNGGGMPMGRVIR